MQNEEVTHPAASNQFYALFSYERGIFYFYILPSSFYLVLEWPTS